MPDLCRHDLLALISLAVGSALLILAAIPTRRPPAA